jgi:hypothetical protein
MWMVRWDLRISAAPHENDSSDSWISSTWTWNSLDFYSRWCFGQIDIPSLFKSVSVVPGTVPMISSFLWVSRWIFGWYSFNVEWCPPGCWWADTLRKTKKTTQVVDYEFISPEESWVSDFQSISSTALDENLGRSSDSEWRKSNRSPEGRSYQSNKQMKKWEFCSCRFKSWNRWLTRGFLLKRGRSGRRVESGNIFTYWMQLEGPHNQTGEARSRECITIDISFNG